MAYDATLVVASCGSRLPWLQPMVSIFSVVVMEQCAHMLTNVSRPEYPVMHVPRCGREAHSYLQFIIRRWDTLPAHIVFMQSDAHKHWSRMSVPDLLALIQSNLTFSMLPGSGQLGSSSCQVNWADVLQLQQRVSNVSRPVTSHTYAHFYATRDRLLGRSFEFYSDLARRFSLGIEGSSSTWASCGIPAATTFERTWPLILGCAEPVRGATDAIYRPAMRDFVQACGCGPSGQIPCKLTYPGFCCQKESETAQLVRGEASPEGCAAWHDPSATGRARYTMHYGPLTRGTRTGFEPIP
mmetsp:Transcript_43881/g.99214  ORF Transcript_43881/g.99214 Transcript_43881/m.99214 type:complete len:297 (+) Transcript_43881:66-956(+)